MQEGKRATLLSGLANFVTGRPVLVIAVLGLIAGGVGSQLPPEADPAPEKLLASAEPQQIIEDDEFRTTFKDSDKVLVVLFEAEDILARESLQYVHDLTRHFQAQDFIASALSITTMPLPREAEEQDEELSLEALEQEMEAEPFDEGEGLTDDPALIDALHQLVNSDPRLFPEGFSALAARVSGVIVMDAVIESDRVSDEEAEELATAISESPLIQGRLISEDRTVAVAVFSLQGEDVGHEDVERAVASIRQYIHDHPPPSEVRVRFGGLPHIRLSIVENMRADQRLLIPLTLVVCMFLLYLSFRWFAGVFLPVIAAGLVVVIELGGMAIADEPMNVINNIIPPLLIIIGITDAIHFIQRYREEYRRTLDPLLSRKRAVIAMGVAVLLTSLTTSVGLASLVVSRTEMLQRFGILAGVGVMVAYVITVTFLPSALTWVRPPPSGGPGTKSLAKAEWLEKVIVLTTRGVLRKSWVILGGTLALLVVLVWGASRINIDHALLDQFDRDSEVYQVTRLMEEKLEGVRPLDVQITTDPAGQFWRAETAAAVDDLAAWVMRRDESLSVMTYSDILHEILVLLSDEPAVREQPFRNDEQIAALSTLVRNREQNPLRAFVSEDGRSVRLSVKLRDCGAKQTLQFIDDLEEEVEREFAPLGGARVAFSGDAYLGSRGLRAVMTDLLGSLFTAVGIIFVLLVLLFRDFRLALLSIPPYVIPLVGTMAYMAARGIPLNATTVIIFSISIGLAVDGSIHVLQRYREEIGYGRSTGVALLRSARGTGRAIAVSSFTLMIGFGVLVFSSFVPVRHFGELIAVTIAACLLSTIVIQPALLRVAGRRIRGRWR